MIEFIYLTMETSIIFLKWRELIFTPFNHDDDFWVIVMVTQGKTEKYQITVMSWGGLLKSLVMSITGQLANDFVKDDEFVLHSKEHNGDDGMSRRQRRIIMTWWIAQNTEKITTHIYWPIWCTTLWNYTVISHGLWVRACVGNYFLAAKSNDSGPTATVPDRVPRVAESRQTGDVAFPDQ